MADNTIPSNSSPEIVDKVLLVDDNTTNLQLLHETLDGLGYKLLIAKNGHTALSIAQKASPSLILLDIMMPFELQVIAHPGPDPFRVNGLGNVIHGSQPQSLGLILVIGQGRYENNRYIGSIFIRL